MKLFPYDEFTVQTPDPPDVVAARLSAIVDPTELFGGRHNPYLQHPYFQGAVWAGGFEVRKIILYRNSFVPVLRGHFKPTPAGTAVHVTMSLQTWVAVFVYVWLGFAGLLFVGFLATGAFAALNGDASRLFGVTVALGPLLAMWATANFGFWWEASSCRVEITRAVTDGGVS